MSTEHAIEECLERIDYTRALLEKQLTELRRLCIEGEAAGGGSSHGLTELSGHMLGMAIVAARLSGATDDNIRTLVDLTLKQG